MSLTEIEKNAIKTYALPPAELGIEVIRNLSVEDATFILNCFLKGLFAQNKKCRIATNPFLLSTLNSLMKLTPDGSQEVKRLFLSFFSKLDNRQVTNLTWDYRELKQKSWEGYRVYCRIFLGVVEC